MCTSHHITAKHSTAQFVTVSSGSCSHRRVNSTWTMLAKWKQRERAKKTTTKTSSTQTGGKKTNRNNNQKYNLLESGRLQQSLTAVHQSLCSASIRIACNYTGHRHKHTSEQTPIRDSSQSGARSTFAEAFQRQQQETNYHAVDQVLSVSVRWTETQAEKEKTRARKIGRERERAGENERKKEKELARAIKRAREREREGGRAREQFCNSNRKAERKWRQIKNKNAEKIEKNNFE